MPQSTDAADAGAVSVTDRDLLARFVGGDEVAFARIVERHAQLVVRVCRLHLHHASDVEDAFQATFFVLARKAASLGWHDSVAGWLHQTARRIALKLRATALRRQRLESQTTRARDNATSPSSSPGDQAAIHELSELLDDELAQLPARFREVILLSQMEGLSRDEIAHRLGITGSAVKDRLERGREQLRSRLLKRGVTLTGAMLAVWLVPKATAGAGLATLTAATAPAAISFACGAVAGASGAVASAKSISLAQGVLHMMGIEKIKTTLFFLVSLLAAGGIALGVLKDEPERFEKGLRGEIVHVETAAQAPTITLRLDEFEVLLSLDIDPAAKVWSAYESTTLASLKKGQYVSLRLAQDHRTVREIHVRGERREFVIQAIDADGRMSVAITEEDDDDGDGATQRPARQVVLARDAIIRIGGLPAARGELTVGMQVPLEFGPDGKTVNAIEAEGDESMIIEGEVAGADAAANQLTVRSEDENDQQVERAYSVPSDALITVDGKPAKIIDIKRGSEIRLRTSADGTHVRALRATSPEDVEVETGAKPSDEPRVRAEKSQDK